MNKKSKVKRLARIYFKKYKKLFQFFTFLFVVFILLCINYTCFMDTEKDRSMRLPSSDYIYTR